MSALFKVTRQERRIFASQDGSHWGADIDARRHNAEIAMTKALKRIRRDEVRDITFVRNVTRYVVHADMVAIAAMIRAFVEKVQPDIMAIEGPVGWVKEDGKSVRYPISLPWGDTANSREDAAQDTFIELMCWMAGGQMRNYLGRDEALAGFVVQAGLPKTTLSRNSVKAICNTSMMSDHPESLKRDMTRLNYTRGFKQYTTAMNSRGKVKPGQIENLLEAFEAAAKALETPVEETL